MKSIIANTDEHHLAEAVARFQAASNPVALTGAGVSVGSGIPDFRSADGLWTVYSPDEYATFDVFMRTPAKAWELYRAMGKILLGKKPNPAHHALAEMEHAGLLNGVVTQNVDNLHQLAGNKNVIEIHGDHQHLQCVQCESVIPVREEHYQAGDIPQCSSCAFPLKPNIVLFGEAVRSLGEIYELIFSCDLLMVIGTSAQVYPAAELPLMVKQNGGLLYEFNKESTVLSAADSVSSRRTDYFFRGDVAETLPMFVRGLVGR
ncbi:MAG: NAD-dependent deacylase [Proteobacteria bacterium]|nr:NAD-dependent deacylase [Pseudomonadota bacterium]MBU1231635.1 NAD-dependent deacylase [Pseudomonadota bacterium]MBU1420609.1 NAD-dependent deacylase [Pseudomonadota bacterium]MBU1455784.1 NAD-dependent deacylase [Pseudomonadota bacterium]